VNAIKRLRCDWDYNSQNKPLRKRARNGNKSCLSDLRPGQNGIVSGLAGGEEFNNRMMALGILPGQTVTVVGGAKHQPYILRFGQNRIMVDWQSLNQIYVEPVKRG
jgi:Fe2+ transport system protein FeoA